MEALITAALDATETPAAAFSVLETGTLEDRLFALGLLMHASVSSDQGAAETLLRALATAVARAEYPDTVRNACLAKFFREAMAFELFGLQVVPEKLFENLELVDSWLSVSRSAADATIKSLFSEAMSSLLNYVNKLPFTLRLARFALAHEDMLSAREGILRLSQTDFSLLERFESETLSEVFPALKSACEVASHSQESPSRFPLTELIHKVLVHLLEAKVPRTAAAMSTVERHLSANKKLFTLTQRESILAAYLKAAQLSQLPSSPEVTAAFGKAAAVVQYEEEEKQAQPTVANKCREFLDALRSAKQQGFVEVQVFANQWRAALLEGEGVVAHSKASTETVEQLSLILKAEPATDNNRLLWKLVISCLNEMGFKAVESYRNLVILARNFIHEEDSYRDGRAARGRWRRGTRR